MFVNAVAQWGARQPQTWPLGKKFLRTMFRARQHAAFDAVGNPETAVLNSLKSEDTIRRVRAPSAVFFFARVQSYLIPGVRRAHQKQGATTMTLADQSAEIE